MNEGEIRKYAALMKELGLTGIEIDEERGYFRLECAQPKVVMADAPVMQQPACAPQAAASYKTVTFRSPMVGVYYAQPTEDGEPFIRVGDSVRKGDVLCIVESMKLMNEIVAENDGVIEEICVENGALIEYGTALFRIKELDV
ncbi:MAG: biotin/lipoyl-containing protein [Peptococcaceae bacterium]|nr:biotin/lipoyl-containing protein [Peptococcaceae bacterium]